MNVLVITIGNSDVQIKKEDEQLLRKWGITFRINERQEQDQYLLLNQPRDGGKVILNHYEEFEPLLEFPIVAPAIEEIIINLKKTLSQIWLVFTDQKNEKQAPKDTLFFSEIIKKYLSPKYPNIEFIDYRISENPVSIDSQYSDFYEKGKRIIEQKTAIETLYVLAQGGIDQINYALTLQFIQLFKGNIVLFQKAEGADLRESHFPKLFLDDLMKNRVVNYINDFDFEKALPLLEVYKPNDIVIKLCKIAADRLGMRHDVKNTFCLNSCTRKERTDVGDELLLKLDIKWKRLENYEKSIMKLSDMIIQCKIDLAKKHNYNDAFVKLFTIIENLFKLKIEELYSRDFNLSKWGRPSEVELNKDNEYISKHWLAFLTKIDSNLISFLNSVKKGEKALQYKTPKNRATFFNIYYFLVKNNKAESVLTCDELGSFNIRCEELAGKRNNIAHNLGYAEEKDLEKVYDQNGFTDFFRKIELLSGVSGYGIFEDIQKKILQQIG